MGRILQIRGEGFGVVSEVTSGNCLNREQVAIRFSQADLAVIDP